MIRVVVTGSECTGKTTLARALAEHHKAPWVSEYARQFVLDKSAAPEYRIRPQAYRDECPGASMFQRFVPQYLRR